MDEVLADPFELLHFGMFVLQRSNIPCSFSPVSFNCRRVCQARRFHAGSRALKLLVASVEA